MSDLPQAGGFLPGAHPIDGYGAGGFRFARMSHRGSILALPTGIFGWPVTQPDEISLLSLDQVFAVPKGQIELLLLGTGKDLVPVAPPLRQALKSAGIVAEPMGTAAAARTYNILLGEGRRVGAALIAVG